jgi:hypothetical protein
MASETPLAVPTSPEILSQLECPVCCESFIGQKIYVCSNGHSVCKSCLPKLTKCPTCSGPLSKIRAYRLEKLADTVLVFCKYRGRGCARLITGSELKNMRLIAIGGTKFGISYMISPFQLIDLKDVHLIGLN